MAARLGVPTDVLLERYTPEQFDEVVALRGIDGDPDERLRHILREGLATIACACGLGSAEVKPEQLDPWHKPVEAKEQFMSPAAASALLRSAYSR